jgi:hypothetical protein
MAYHDAPDLGIMDISNERYNSEESEEHNVQNEEDYGYIMDP